MAVPDFRTRRIKLRRDSTDAENRLWHHLRAHRLKELKFRRQHQIGPYIADFYCHTAGLVIELDGSQHLEPDGAIADFKRTKYLEEQGLRVVRFTNIQVLTELDGVLAAILELVTPSP